MEMIPELVHMSNSDLEDLLKSEHKMDAFVDTLPDISAINNRCQQLSDENHAQASANVEREVSYEKARDMLIKKVEELTNIQQSFDRQTQDHLNLTDKLSPRNIQQTMVIAASQSEEESETLTGQFLQKNMEIDGFLEKFLAKRIESHLRKFKGERLGDQLKELHRAGF